MNSKMIEDIKKSMNERTNENLIGIWTKNDRREWSDEALEAVRLILVERGITPPIQNVPPDTQRRRDIAEQMKTPLLPAERGNSY